MSNPTHLQIFGKQNGDVNDALGFLGIPSVELMDARLGVQRILTRLVERNKALILAGTRLRTYSADVSVDNIDINTQRQTFTIIIDMGLTVDYAENELVIPS